MDKFGLSEHIIDIINDFFETITEIETVKIFGSRAKGTFKPNSDIDFVLYGNGITDKLTRHIASGLDELPTPYKFDVVNFESIENENLIKNINQEGKIFYQKSYK